jgi:NCS1 family nucleobase:cation symporter-1
VVTSNQFTTYLSAYSLFLSAIAGVMICDYYIVRKGYLDIKALYSGSKTAPYYYTLGFSWRAYAAYFAGILINIVGFAGAVGRDVPVGAQYIYNINYFTGVLVSGGTYWILIRIFPVPATSDRWNEVDIDEIDDYGVAYGQSVSDEENTGYDRRSITDSLPPDEQKKGINTATKRV